MAKAEIQKLQCLRSRFAKLNCNVCREACPHQAITGQLTVTASCTDCGLCLAACPAQAIASASYQPEQIGQRMKQAGSVRLICQKCQPDSPWPCLGFLDTVLLLALVYSAVDKKREVLIYKEECPNCSLAVTEHLGKVVSEANRVLAGAGGAVCSAKTKFSGEVTAAISRRRFFAELFGASVAALREVASPSEERARPLPRREWLIKHGADGLIRANMDNQSTFQSMVVADSCNACALCAKVCNVEALTVTLRQDYLYIEHDPVRCRHCRVCAAYCPQAAISFKPATAMKKMLARAATLPRCAECGNAFQPIGNSAICFECLQKTKSLLLEG